MPELNKKSQSVESELQSLETAAVDQARYLQLAESLDGFRVKLRERAKTLDVSERQQILRLLVKEVLVAADRLTIRHSIPIPQAGTVSNEPQPTGSYPSGASQKPSYLLRSGSKNAGFVERKKIHKRPISCKADSFILVGQRAFCLGSPQFIPKLRTDSSLVVSCPSVKHTGMRYRQRPGYHRRPNARIANPLQCRSVPLHHHVIAHAGLTHYACGPNQNCNGKQIKKVRWQFKCRYGRKGNTRNHWDTPAATVNESSLCESAVAVHAAD
jgi:hypothetical protein